jgi:N-acyl-D-aspartate/D-glutamate deacylase
MSEFDTVIRDGLVVDGTGAAPFYADVGIKAGKVAEIGRLRSARAAEVIDAAGKIVAPGHVTQHSHYDAMLFWNPYCSNSGENGCTTVVNANCGFGFAPVRPADHERTMAMMESTEQIPVTHQRTALPWDWESFPQFLERVRGLRKGVNVLTYLPINPLMIYVMGVDAAKSRPPTSDEMAEMHRLINEAMDAGAMGISLSAMGLEGNSHVDFDGTPMPTDAMDAGVAVDLSRALARRGEGVVQLLAQIAHYGDRSVTEKIAEACKGSGARVVHNIFLTTDDVDKDLAWLSGLRARGLDVTAQTIAYRGWVEHGVRQLENAAGQLPAIRRIVACRSDDEVMALVSQPEFQRQFEQDYAWSGPTSGASGFEAQIVLEVGALPELQAYLGRSLGEIAAEKGESVIKVLVDLIVRSKMALELKSAPIASTDPRHVVKLMSHSGVSIGVSDGGAHTKSHALGHYGTDYLIWLVREEKLMALEELHYQLSLKAAQALTIRDRGAVLPGFWADLVVYDLEKLYVDQRRMEIVNDMPNGDWRRKVRAGGYDRILVNGVTTHVQDRPTGATPGQFVQVTTPGATRTS